MATKGSRYYTMRDLLAGRTPNGFVDKDVVEMMAQENPVLQDVLWKECNKGREDFVTIRTGMPDAVTRAYYEGFKGSKSSKKQVTNSCCTVTTGLEFDWRMYQEDKDKVAFLTDEQRAHASTLGDKVASLLFYGSTESDARGINGFARTFGEYGLASGSGMMTDDKKAAFYCLNGGDSASAQMKRSLFLVGWGPRSVHGIYPEGTSSGIQIGQLVNQYQSDGDGGNVMMGLQEMNWNAGLNIRDFRYCGRIANINIATDPTSSGATDVTKLVRKLVTRVKSNGVRQRMYMSRLLFEHIADQFAKLTNANAVRYADLEQKKDASLMGIPVSFCDALNADEDAVTQAS